MIEVSEPGASLVALKAAHNTQEPFSDLPPGWKTVKLGDVLQEVDVRVRDGDPRMDKHYPVLSLTKNHGLVPQADRFKKRIATDDVSLYKVVRHAQLVYNPYVIWEGAIHTLRRFPDGIVSPVYPVWRTKDADPWFIDNLIRTPLLIRAYQRFSSGAVNRRRSISKRAFLQIQIPYPPVPEQQAIARCLESIHRAVDASGAVISATEELKKSVMRHCFAHGSMMVGQTEFHNKLPSEIGPVPESWKVVALGRIATITSGGTPDRSRPEYWNGTIPWVKTGEVNYDAIMGAAERITQKGLEESSARIVPAGTILMAMYGQGATRGRVAKLGIDAAINQACAAIEAGPQVLPDYLFFYLSYSYERIRGMAHGAHQKNLNAGMIRSFPVPIPPLAEQAEISRRLKALTSELSCERVCKKALEMLFRSAAQGLMSGIVRVNVGSRLK